MIAFRCLACRTDLILSPGIGTFRCSCGRSTVTLDDRVVELVGPCAASELGVDDPTWAADALTTIRRKPVPPLL